ncbi:glycosyltransferase involved in cell wall biosynthesis [Evansella vedderi]|uniref:Glycosyltransferase involved in cell wall biosynthesis n=1 Tax=Evansella vedderi TaxID=38282 RepID=A0ABT9ZX82_9BACI|nr:glycosyltransferase involved in cell wall biosynthesis [Evansella vedderi]
MFEKEAKSLKKMGFDVTIVAGKREGKLFTIGKKPVFQKEEFYYDGIHFVTYDAHYPLGQEKKVMIRKMIEELRNGAQSYFIDGLAQKALAIQADIYHAHEWETLYDAVQIKRILRNEQKRNIKVIFDAHELESDNLLMKELMKEVDYIITVSNGLKSQYAQRYPKVPITVIYNSPHFEKQIPPKDFSSKLLTIAYEGSLTKDKGDPEKIAEIINHCKTKINFKFKIIGGMPKLPEYQGVMQKMKSNPYIQWVDWVDYHDLPKQLSNVHIGYINFRLNTPNREYALPNKFFSYLNSGIPVVVNAAHEMEEFIKRHKCGIVIKKGEATAEDYATQFVRLYNNRLLLKKMSENARSVIRSTYGWEMMESRLRSIYSVLSK